jgi:hypothetical protein
MTRDKLLTAIRCAVRATEEFQDDSYSMTMARLHALLTARPTMLATIVREISRVENMVRKEELIQTRAIEKLLLQLNR